MHVRRLVLCLLLLAVNARAVDDAVERAAMLAAVEADVRASADVLGRASLSGPVRDALLAVPRHRFVPEDLRRFAYDNRPLPIGHGQTISQPTIVAMMTDLLGVAPGDTVLEVGTGSGYQAAVLAELGVHVLTIEIVPELAAGARRILAELGYDDVEVFTGDGWAGLPGRAPFDAVLVTAAPEEVPPALVEQLKPGGRLVIPVGPRGLTQQLTVLERTAAGGATSRRLLAVRFVPLVREDQ